MTPNYAASREFYNFEDSYHLQQTEDYIHIQFDHPLRTVSNGVIGEGIQWLKHFCSFQIEKDGCQYGEDLQERMDKYSIPSKQAAGMVTSARLEDTVIVTEKYDNIQMMLLVTAEVKNPAYSTKDSVDEEAQTRGPINMMLFIDAYFTDGALMDGYMAATEAKVKALGELHIEDPDFHTDAFGPATDTLLIGLTQQGTKISCSGSGTVVGKGISQIVYRAIKDALGKTLLREVFLK